jgi:hypothetical protein
MQHDLNVATSPTKEKRQAHLGELAADLDDWVQALAAAGFPEQQKLLADLYARVVRRGGLPAKRPPADRSADDVKVQAEHLRRHGELVRGLVDDGLVLADTDDALGRAHYCAETMAPRLTGELHRSAQARESRRVAELGQHLQALLQQGVADNLAHVEGNTPPERLTSIRTRTLEAYEAVNSEVGRTDGDVRDEVMKAAHRVGDARRRVEDEYDRRPRR